jgi:hypothetical protein
VSPEDEAERQRASRHEERAEVAAGRVRQLLGGLTGTILMSRIGEAWDARDAEKLAESVQALGELARQAYHEMEAASDPLEIYVGVVMTEAWELTDAAPGLVAVPPGGWDSTPAARHLSTLREYFEQAQQRLHEIQDRT